MAEKWYRADGTFAVGRLVFSKGNLYKLDLTKLPPQNRSAFTSVADLDTEDQDTVVESTEKKPGQKRSTSKKT